MKIHIHAQDSLSPLERRRAIQNRQEFDRMPVNLFIPEIKAKIISCPINDLYANEDQIVKAEIETFNRFGMDWFFTGPNSKGMAMTFGVPVVFFKDRSPQIKDYILEDYSQMDAISGEMDWSRIQFFDRVLARLMELGGDVVNIGVSIGGPLTIASYLRGTENLLRDLRKNPVQLKQLIQVVVTRQKAVVDLYSQYSGITIALADPVASGSLLSTKQFNEFVFPALKDIAQYITQVTGQSPSLHMCGKVERIWPSIKSLELSTFSIDNLCDLKEAIDYFGDNFPITGNVPPVEVMYKGGKREIDQAVKRCIHLANGNPQVYVPGLGCDMPHKAPVENIQHFMDAVRKYGAYSELVDNYHLYKEVN